MSSLKSVTLAIKGIKEIEIVDSDCSSWGHAGNDGFYTYIEYKMKCDATASPEPYSEHNVVVKDHYETKEHPNGPSEVTHNWELYFDGELIRCRYYEFNTIKAALQAAQAIHSNIYNPYEAVGSIVERTLNI